MLNTQPDLASRAESYLVGDSYLSVNTANKGSETSGGFNAKADYLE